MIVENEGKLYNIDDETGLVTEASVKEEDSTPDFSDELHLGQRVEVTGVGSGKLVSITASVYGGAYGVLFDNGDVDEYPEGQLKATTIEEIEHESPLHEIFARFNEYEALPHYTNEELEAKEKEARYLKLRASSLRSDPKLAFSQQNDLERVVLVTGNDLHDIKELRESSTSEENSEYLDRFNRFSIAKEVGQMQPTLGMQGDASWLDSGVDDMEVVETTDTDLAARATEMVAHFTKVQLEDDEFMSIAASFQNDYLKNEDGREKKFTAYLDRARAERINELKLDESNKVATAEENLDDIDDAAIFNW